MVTADILEILKEVKDPEIPIIDVVELGIVRDVVIDGDEVRVDITPTYSGCPAMQVIERDIVSALHSHGFEKARVNTVFSPAWTTDWITPDRQENETAAFGGLERDEVQRVVGEMQHHERHQQSDQDAFHCLSSLGPEARADPKRWREV